MDEDQVCTHCGADIDFEEIVWIDPATGDIVIEAEGGGDPYHEECIP